MLIIPLHAKGETDYLTQVSKNLKAFKTFLKKETNISKEEKQKVISQIKSLKTAKKNAHGHLY